jgi:hypothetical protein
VFVDEFGHEYTGGYHSKTCSQCRPLPHKATNYFIQAQNSGPIMEQCTRQTIAALRREAAEEGHCQEFRDQCIAQANELEAELNGNDEH